MVLSITTLILVDLHNNQSAVYLLPTQYTCISIAPARVSWEPLTNAARICRIHTMHSLLTLSALVGLKIWQSALQTWFDRAEICWMIWKRYLCFFGKAGKALLFAVSCQILTDETWSAVQLVPHLIGFQLPRAIARFFF